LAAMKDRVNRQYDTLMNRFEKAIA
jgi:hypothetical protein